MFMDFKAIKDTRLHHTYLFKERKTGEELSDIQGEQHGKLSLTEIADISGLSLKEVESLN